MASAAATGETSLAPLFHRRLLRTGKHPSQGGPAGWQSLAHPISGYTSVDGLPVLVVATRRHSATAQLQVVRGHPASSQSPDGDRDRHLIPAASFNPHPQRALSIGGENFRFNTLANSASCRSCGKDDLGFGFVSVAIPPDGSDPDLAPNRSLCEACAESQARVAG